MRFKTTLFSLLQSILVYLVAKSYIGSDEAILITSILTSFGLSINLYTNSKKYGSKK